MKIFGSPFRYIQGAGVIGRLGNIIAPIGARFLLVVDGMVKDTIGNRISDSLQQAGKHFYMVRFGGECSNLEICRIMKQVRKESLDVIVGVGGGKTADTAKVLSIKLDLPVVIVPTLASNDAPTTHFAVMYDENHAYDHMEVMKLSPWYVVADTEILIKAPRRFFIAGIGDAMATKFEADACASSGANNYFEGRITQTALAMANLSWDIIKDRAVAALDAVSAGIINQEFEDVVEATILLSGLGFENCGLAAAHAISSGFTILRQTQEVLHGEMVAFGLLVQFILEERSQDFINEMLSFYTKIGLPIKLSELGIEPATYKNLAPAIKTICAPDSTIENMPFEVKPEIMGSAILKANRLGEAFKC